ncbi:OmpA family protein [Parvibaculum sp.]|uniref:OmpA family protein n=1 Tax=Parvibaculum sp. TaxID=2024848 RepID=UPI000C4AD924|nr:OmpA family protein [Parvibaculum sp.]MAU61647.1 cell envelope biogenesis protein OmpA [Parvibaculum sp.]MBO6666585.1 OmpA family protein [Parvibaculum sp.]MBO6692324.1 OmpA family protein [Parvibaculum sp.]MBO6713206.1 OmpA family protein [Parvibaculum sp.]
MMKKFAILAVCASFGLAACQTQDPYTGEQKTSKATYGALIGAVGGALAGGLIGKGDAKDRRERALIGAGVGALAGGGIGYYMDKQEAELTKRLRASGVSVTRVGNDIILNMPGNITFATDSSDINARFYEVLNSVAIVLKEYNQTLIDVTGHTDSTGSDQYNLELSQRRAQSVANYLMAQGLDSRRFYILGAGESQPIATNDTAAGREQNRRVEIRLSPLTASS